MIDLVEIRRQRERVDALLLQQEPLGALAHALHLAEGTCADFVPALCDEVERLQAVIDALDETLSRSYLQPHD